jgi:hypothetical protein
LADLWMRSSEGSNPSRSGRRGGRRSTGAGGNTSEPFLDGLLESDTLLASVAAVLNADAKGRFTAVVVDAPCLGMSTAEDWSGAVTADTLFEAGRPGASVICAPPLSSGRPLSNVDEGGSVDVLL